LEHRFAEPAERVWGAVRAALPSVVRRATFWELEHRVEWSTDLGPTDWGQTMALSVGVVDAHSAAMTLRGHTLGRPPTIFDPRRRRRMFRVLVDGVERALLEHPGQFVSAGADDGVQWWDGVQWRDTRETPDPGPPAPGRPPPAWHPDPSGRHQLRYWDGQGWTDHVCDDGATTSDRL
jgi:hypothetical protein